MEDTIRSVEEQNEEIRAQNRGIMNFAFTMVMICASVIAGGAVCVVL